MGGCSARPYSVEELDMSKKIDKELRRDRREYSDEVKLLLLGAGQSGKSTIFKQMKILHQNGYTQEELKNSLKPIHTNITVASKMLLYQAEKFGYDVSSLEKERNELDNLVEGEFIPPELIPTIENLWKSQVIQETYSRSAEYILADSAGFFLNNARKYITPGYVPTPDDVLKTRIKTTGIVETSWEMDRTIFKMFDVGGQRNERKKWIHCFDNATAVIYVAAISEYDQILEEDSKKNRVEESLTLFDQICNSRYFEQTAMILFLNKTDIFREKLSHVDLKVCFPDFPGPQDYDTAVAFIKNKFVELNLQENRIVYVHLTCATNTENIAFVFLAVKDIVLAKGLSNSGFT